MKVVFFKKIKNTSYIPVGIDIEFYKPRPRTGRIKNINLNKKFVIISVANMVPVKGIETLIKAYLTLKNELNIDLALLLVGNCNGNYGQKLKILSKDDKDIYFFGKKKDVRPYLAEADVFVIPTLSKGEGQGVAPLEAMAMQIPVIASNVYGLKDIMKFQKNNLFKPGDVFDLKSKLECELLKKQNENFTKCILLPEEFHLKTMMKKYESLYQNILS